MNLIMDSMSLSIHVRKKIIDHPLCINPFIYAVSLTDRVSLVNLVPCEDVLEFVQTSPSTQPGNHFDDYFYNFIQALAISSITQKLREERLILAIPHDS